MPRLPTIRVIGSHDISTRLPAALGGAAGVGAVSVAMPVPQRYCAAGIVETRRTHHRGTEHTEKPEESGVFKPCSFSALCSLCLCGEPLLNPSSAAVPCTRW